MLIVPSVVVVGSPAFATSPPATVCASGCAFGTIQAAINAAAPGAIITIAPGTYVENLVVTTSVSLVGAGDSTVLYPAASGPTCASGDSTLCAGSSTMILVQADNVSISNLRLEGANPSLTGGALVGGVWVNARNGIIENYHAGTFNGTSVQNVTVSDIYHRAIYMSSGGSGFTIANNSVTNVQGSPSSIAIFNFGGSGVIAGNHVSYANDAISANWSSGTQFLSNVVTNSGSGIHTDNNGGSGGGADLIRGNTILQCPTDGYGIFVFAPYVSATVSDNHVSGCAVGLSAFGSQGVGVTTTFANNRVSGQSAQTTDPFGTYGLFVVTDLLGFGAADVNVIATGNSIAHFTTGLFVSQTTTFYNDAPGGHATVSAAQNSFTLNTVGAFGDSGTTVTATNNWWGCPQGPTSGSGCDSALGTVTVTPWLTSAPPSMR